MSRISGISGISERAKEYGGLHKLHGMLFKKITDWRQASNRGNGSHFPPQAK